MRKSYPLVESKEVERFLKRWPFLHPSVQAIFADLKEIYERGDVEYRKRGKHTRFNLRHPTHPQTNLSEANALHFLASSGHQVRYIEDETQYSGTDFDYLVEDQWISTSVKLCSMAGKCLTIHYKIREALYTDPSQQVFFIDNIHQSGLLMKMSDVRGLLSLMPVSLFARNRNILWYDKLLGKQVTFCGNKANEQHK
ncbi:MAG: hypothetical protein E4H14_01935 [Candidatus Thorarchaeota archaeon]|nr:MAG: hypothetical protein E4H14_01935 [Candidatus Thorarchaeota archaeon]